MPNQYKIHLAVERPLPPKSGPIYVPACHKFVPASYTFKLTNVYSAITCKSCLRVTVKGVGTKIHISGTVARHAVKALEDLQKRWGLNRSATLEKLIMDATEFTSHRGIS